MSKSFITQRDMIEMIYQMRGKRESKKEDKIPFPVDTTIKLTESPMDDTQTVAPETPILTPNAADSTEPSAPIEPSKTEELTAQTEFVPKKKEEWNELEENEIDQVEKETILDENDSSLGYLLENYNDDEILEALGDYDDTQLANLKDLKAAVIKKKCNAKETAATSPKIDFRHLYIEKMNDQKNLMLFMRNTCLFLLISLPAFILIGVFETPIPELEPYPNFTLYEVLAYYFLFYYAPLAKFIFIYMYCINAELLRRFIFKNTSELQSYFIALVYLFSIPVLCSAKSIFGSQISLSGIHFLFIVSLVLFSKRPRIALYFQYICMLCSPVLPLFFSLWYFLFQTNNAVKFKIRFSIIKTEKAILWCYFFFICEYIFLQIITNIILNGEYLIGHLFMFQWSHLTAAYLQYYLISTIVLFSTNVIFLVFSERGDLRKLYQLLIMLGLCFLLFNPLMVLIPSLAILFISDIQARAFQYIEAKYLKSKEENMFIEV